MGYHPNDIRLAGRVIPALIPDGIATGLAATALRAIQAAAENPDIFRQYQDWRAENPDIFRQYQDWRAENPDIFRQDQNRRKQSATG